MNVSATTGNTLSAGSGGNGGAGGANGGGGGGGGGASLRSGGNGGFGGGGGKASLGSPGAGGFGAASATAPGGTGGAGNNGSAYGADLFLGGTVTFDVPTSLTVTSLGGAGNPSDPNVAGRTGDPNAQGGLVKTGAGALFLSGSNYYVGPTTVRSGTLALAASSLEQGTSSVTVGLDSGDVAALALGSSSTLTLGGFNGSSGTDAPLVIAQAAGSTGTVVIGNGAGSNGAFVGARVFTGGAGNATVQFTQQYAAEPGTNPVYPFYTSLTGSLGIVQAGLGSFTGPVAVNAGTLATTGTAAALAGAASIAVNAGGTLLLGQTGGVNDAAAVTLAGGVLQTGTSLSETLGALNVTGGASIIDFLGTASTLNFSTLSLGGPLAIWNYAGANDFLNIASGTATGSLAQISFYADAGQTFLGTGTFSGTSVVPVPEPSACILAGAAVACGGLVVRRLRR